MHLSVARQPIFDFEGRIAGYELLYRRTVEASCAEPRDATAMSSDVIVQGFVELGLERMTGGAPAFVNFGRDLLLSGSYNLLSPSSVVIEILEDVEPDREVVEACGALTAAGYRLALDDYVVGGDQRVLIPLASIIKLDVLDRTTDEIEATGAELRAPGVTLLAERIESEEAYQAARRSGFTLFQGYYFSKPETVAHTGQSVDALQVLPLMNALLDDRVTDTQVEAMFQKHPPLCYKLLRIVSSANYGHGGITSIQHAVRMLGRRPLHRWLALLLASSLAAGNTFAEELVRTTLIRAHLLELLAARTTYNAGALGLLGMFSRMDALLNLSTQELLQNVSLAPEISDALLRQPGASLLPWLELVECYEAGAWSEVSRRAAGLGVSEGAVVSSYPEAVRWADNMMNTLGAV